MDNKIIGLLVIFFLSFAIFIIFVFFNKPLSTLTRASEESKTVSPAESKIIFYPYTVKADGKSSSVIQVFLVSIKGNPIKDKRVRLQTSLGSVVESELSKSDEDHSYYTFHLISNIEGTAQVEAIVDNNMILNQKISVLFTK